MLLYDTFVALHLHRPHALLPQEIITQLLSTEITPLDLAEAKKHRTAAYRCIRHEHSKANITHLQEAYGVFITTCEAALEHQQSSDLRSILISFFKQTHHINQWLQLLNFNPAPEALLSFSPLARHFVDNPDAFASLLGWFILQGATPKALLETHIIQDYLRYHLLSSALYQTLSSQPETMELADALTTTRFPEAGLLFRALDGSVQTSQPLDTPPQHIPSCSTPLTAIEFDALQEIFGVHFLAFALEYFSDYQVFLKQTLNFDAHPRIYLPELLHHVQASEMLKQTLAACLSNETFDALIDARIGDVLMLLPYAAYLREKISETDLNTYLQAIQKNAHSSLDLVGNLSQLLRVFKHQEESSALLVFDALIHAIIQDPSLLDDDSLLTQLQKFRSGSVFLEKKMNHFTHTFNAFVQLHASVAEFDYIPIEDEWRDTHIKINTLQQIISIPVDFPKDKHALHSLLAKTLFQTQAFELDVFIHTLGITPNCHPTEVLAYERLLLNILVALDDTALRLDIIARLDSQISPLKNWRTKQYDNKSLAKLAAEAGNIGLIQWLESKHIRRKESISELIMLSAKNNHWPLVTYFHAHYPLNQTIIDTLLNIAMKQNAAFTIPLFWEGKLHTPRSCAIEKNFIEAIRQEKFLFAEALLCCKTPPSNTSLTKGFKLALKTQQFEIAQRIAEHHAQACLKSAINQMLPDLIRSNEIDLIHFLGGIKNNPITQNTLDNALHRAVRAKNISATQALYTLPFLVPRPEARKQALRNAEKTGQDVIITFLSNPALPVHPHHQTRTSLHALTPASMAANTSLEAVASPPLKALGFFSLSSECLSPRPESPLKRSVSNEPFPTKSNSQLDISGAPP